MSTLNKGSNTSASTSLLRHTTDDATRDLLRHKHMLNGAAIVSGLVSLVATLVPLMATSHISTDSPLAYMLWPRVTSCTSMSFCLLWQTHFALLFFFHGCVLFAFTALAESPIKHRVLRMASLVSLADSAAILSLRRHEHPWSFALPCVVSLLFLMLETLEKLGCICVVHMCSIRRRTTLRSGTTPPSSRVLRPDAPNPSRCNKAHANCDEPAWLVDELHRECAFLLGLAVDVMAVAQEESMSTDLPSSASVEATLLSSHAPPRAWQALGLPYKHTTALRSLVTFLQAPVKERRMMDLHRVLQNAFDCLVGRLARLHVDLAPECPTSWLDLPHALQHVQVAHPERITLALIHALSSLLAISGVKLLSVAFHEERHTSHVTNNDPRVMRVRLQPLDATGRPMACDGADMSRSSLLLAPLGIAVAVAGTSVEMDLTVVRYGAPTIDQAWMSELLQRLRAQAYIRVACDAYAPSSRVSKWIKLWGISMVASTSHAAASAISVPLPTGKTLDLCMVISNIDTLRQACHCMNMAALSVVSEQMMSEYMRSTPSNASLGTLQRATFLLYVTNMADVAEARRVVQQAKARFRASFKLPMTVPKAWCVSFVTAPVCPLRLLEILRDYVQALDPSLMADNARLLSLSDDCDSRSVAACAAPCRHADVWPDTTRPSPSLPPRLNMPIMMPQLTAPIINPRPVLSRDWDNDPSKLHTGLLRHRARPFPMLGGSCLSENAAAQEPPPMAYAINDSRRLKFLIMSRRPDDMASLVQWLDAHEHSFIMAATINETLSYIRILPCDVALVDTDDVEDPAELLCRLRAAAHERPSRTVCIAIAISSSPMLPHANDECARFNDVLVKPLDMQQVKARLEEWAAMCALSEPSELSM